MKSRLKRFTFLLHRWLGIGMCVLIALWFASGIVMMYVEYPELTEAERLDGLPPIPLELIGVDAPAAAALLEPGGQGIAALRLSTVLGRPAYQFTHLDGQLSTVFADDGSLLHGVPEDQAELAVRHSAFGAPSARPRHAGTVDVDQWTVSAVLDPHRPLHKLELGDAAGTVVYVSSSTGQIVRDATRSERFWNWLGSTIHWIYPWQLRRNTELWANIIIVLSLLGLVSIVSGAIVGWWRLRVRRPYWGRRVTPYRGMYKWHHLVGLGSLVFLLTFMFSGLMSMAPWGVFANATSAAPAIDRYTGGGIEDLADYPPVDMAAGGAGLKQVEWMRLNGEPHLVASRSAAARAVIGTGGRLTSGELRARVEQAAGVLLPDAPRIQTELIAEYDDYYYSHHNRYRPLPVLRVQFADPERSWFHLDLNTGQAVNRLTRTDRIARWLYNGLHSLDFSLLFQRRPLWDFVVILLCVIGIVFSVTSVWVGWRRLSH